MPVVKLTYRVRDHFLAFHARDQRWSILVAHRRAGKTVAVVNDLIAKAAYNDRENPRYAYIAPLYRQAKEIAWQYLKDYAAPFNPKISESGLYVELPHNGARITLYGADNPDAFRGLYFDGVALDEYGNMRPSVWKEVLLPTLLDRDGWAVFMGTPNGPNHFRNLYEERKEDRMWHVEFLPYTKTNALSAHAIEQARDMMSEEEFQQEMECSFAASTRGAFWAREIAKSEASGHILDIAYDRHAPLNWVFDLGWRDDTAMIGWQERPDCIAIMIGAQDNRKPIPHYIDVMHSTCELNGVKLGEVWLPHDARAKSLQTGRSIVEQFVSHGIMPTIVPQLSVQDGIAAARMMFPHYRFNKEPTKDLVLAIKSYHREYDEKRQDFVDSPFHDWSSHFADDFRYLSLVSQRKGFRTRREQAEITSAEREIMARGVHYAFNLEELYDARPRERESEWRM